MLTFDHLQGMDAAQLRDAAAQLITQRDALEREVRFKQHKIDQLAHEMAILKRWKFAARSEQLHGEQRRLFDETIQADLAAIEHELESLKGEIEDAPKDKSKPKRQPLPAHLPRTEIRHEPERTQCACGCELKRIGEDISEKLDYTPGVFTVERHIRGKWVCSTCETLTQAPVPAHVIDKGIPTAGLLAHVLVAKYHDHQPLYRQEAIFGRAGLEIPRSTLAQWSGVCGVRLQPLVDALRTEMLARAVLHADETPVSMLVPGKGKTHRAYIWAYATTPFDDLQGVIYDFAPGRSGEHAAKFLQGWGGTLVCDDFAGYKALFANGVTEAGCLAHARRKFHDLHANHASPLAGEALGWFSALYEIERLAQDLDNDQRRRLRQLKAKPIADSMHQWLTLQRQRCTDGTAIAKAIDYSRKRWAALMRYLDDGRIPIDNNHLENRIRPVALGRSNWLFAGSLRGGRRSAAAMSLIQSAKLNGLNPHAYLKDVLERLPTQPNRRIDELLPHNWQPQTTIH